MVVMLYFVGMSVGSIYPPSIILSAEGVKLCTIPPIWQNVPDSEVKVPKIIE